MRLFYDKYKNCQPVAGNLSWSHYCYLIYIEDDDERSFYEKECINSKWSKRELKRQIDSSNNMSRILPYVFTEQGTAIK